MAHLCLIFILFLGLSPGVIAEIVGTNQGTAEILDGPLAPVCKKTTLAEDEALLKIKTCEEEKRQANCQEIEAQLSDKSSLRDCKKTILCAEYDSGLTYFKACMSNWGAAWSDMLNGLLVGGATEAEIEMQRKVDFLASCLDANCKRNALGYYQKYFTEEQLGKGQLSDKEKKEIIDSQFRDPAIVEKYKDKLGVPLESLLKELFKKLAKEYPNQKKLPVPYKVPWSSRVVAYVDNTGPKTLSEWFMKTGSETVDAVDKFLDKLGVKNRACYDPLKVREMQCYAFFSILDPTIAVGAIAKIDKIAQFGRLKTGTEKGSRAAIVSADRKLPVSNTTVSADVLARNGALGFTERIIEAEKTLGRSLGDTEKNALWKAHNIAPERGYGTYSKTDLAAKVRILKEAGFSMEEIDLLMRSGLAGKPPGSMPEKLIKISQNSRDFKTIALSNSQREVQELQNLIETQATITGNKAVYNGVTFYRVKDAGGRWNWNFDATDSERVKAILKESSTVEVRIPFAQRHPTEVVVTPADTRFQEVVVKNPLGKSIKLRNVLDSRAPNAAIGDTVVIDGVTFYRRKNNYRAPIWTFDISDAERVKSILLGK